jgi:arylesterase/paraoxonase
MRAWKKSLAIVFALLAIAALLLAIRFVRATSLFSTIEEVAANCRVIEAVPGPEDIVIDRARGVAYVSATDRRILMAGGAASTSLRGGIYRIDLNAPPEQWTLVPVTPASPESFRPHGLGLFIDGEGSRSLFVVNHPAGGPDEVVILDVDGQGRLIHRRTITDPLMTNLNDVQPVGADRFYATNDHAAGTSKALQDFLMLDRTNFVYFDGSQARVAAEGLSYANGVNVSSDGREIYVAETLDRALRVYRREIGSGDLELTDIVQLDSGADNIDVLENGDLLVGAHPKILDFASHAEDPSALSPSQVVRVSRNEGGDWSVRTLYLNHGDEVSGVATAAGYRDMMLLGPVFQPRIMACRQLRAP